MRISEEFPLILASSSPRRKRLLAQVGLPFRPLPCHIDEEHHGADPRLFTRMLAEKKAAAASLMAPNQWILGADTVVVLDEVLLGKPRDKEDAAHMLRSLSGRDHRVITGFSIIDPSGKVVHSENVRTLVTVKELSKNEINSYISTGEPFGKAGSYGIQGIGAFMIKGIEGSYTNVVGLPVYELVEALVGLGALDGFPFFL